MPSAPLEHLNLLIKEHKKSVSPYGLFSVRCQFLDEIEKILLAHQGQPDNVVMAQLLAMLNLTPPDKINYDFCAEFFAEYQVYLLKIHTPLRNILRARVQMQLSTHFVDIIQEIPVTLELLEYIEPLIAILSAEDAGELAEYFFDELETAFTDDSNIRMEAESDASEEDESCNYATHFEILVIVMEFAVFLTTEQFAALVDVLCLFLQEKATENRDDLDILASKILKIAKRMNEAQLTVLIDTMLEYFQSNPDTIGMQQVLITLLTNINPVGTLFANSIEIPFLNLAKNMPHTYFVEELAPVIIRFAANLSIEVKQNLIDAWLHAFDFAKLAEIFILMNDVEKNRVTRRYLFGINQLNPLCLQPEIRAAIEKFKNHVILEEVSATISLIPLLLSNAETSLHESLLNNIWFIIPPVLFEHFRLKSRLLPANIFHYILLFALDEQTISSTIACIIGYYLEHSSEENGFYDSLIQLRERIPLRHWAQVIDMLSNDLYSVGRSCYILEKLAPNIPSEWVDHVVRLLCEHLSVALQNNYLLPLRPLSALAYRASQNLQELVLTKLTNYFKNLGSRPNNFETACHSICDLTNLINRPEFTASIRHYMLKAMLKLNALENCVHLRPKDFAFFNRIQDETYHEDLIYLALQTIDIYFNSDDNSACIMLIKMHNQAPFAPRFDIMKELIKRLTRESLASFVYGQLDELIAKQTPDEQLSVCEFLMALYHTDKAKENPTAHEFILKFLYQYIPFLETELAYEVIANLPDECATERKKLFLEIYAQSTNDTLDNSLECSTVSFNHAMRM